MRPLTRQWAVAWLCLSLALGIGFTYPDAKSAYRDLLTITRMNALVKQKKMIEAQRLADSISLEETRAWALLAVATEAAKEDRILGFESISKALKALDAASLAKSI